MVGKKELICNVNNVTSYTILDNSTNILYRGSSGSNVVKKIGFICEGTKSYTPSYYKIMEESINPAFHAQVVIMRVSVEVAMFKAW